MSNKAVNSRNQVLKENQDFACLACGGLGHTIHASLKNEKTPKYQSGSCLVCGGSKEIGNIRFNH